MHILCLGLNHNSAPIDLREKLAFSEQGTRSALARLGCGEELKPIHELVILSTCNRTELYFVFAQQSFGEIEAFLSESHDLPVAEFKEHVYKLSDEQAVDHLFRVAAGLDSLVMGEPQILGQVTHALELALGLGTAGAILSRLFRSAIHTGKRARTETAISHNPASISSLAASLVEEEVPDLVNAQVLVVGAGEMAELAVEALRKRGVSRITVLNRTLEKAHALAERWQASASTFEQLEDCLSRMDILISSTSAPHTVISASMVQAAMRKHPRPHLIMVDIAVPRDIEPEVGDIPGVSLFDIDTMDQQVQQHLAARSAEVPHVEAILQEEKRQFMEYMGTLDMLPLITRLREQAESIRNQELEKTFHRLPGLTEQERDRISAMTRALVKKILANPTERLRMEASCPHAPEYATVARTLFELEDGQSVCAFSNEICLQSSDFTCPERLS